jgi:tetratricopeptide (TPR) repeat protein
MKRFSISIVFVLMSAGVVFGDTPSWKTNYEKGLSLLAQGQYQSAKDYLRMAAADKPISEIMTEKNESLEYLPYLQIGICYYQLGKVQLAREFLDLESNLAAISQSRAGKDLMNQYRNKLETADQPEQADTIENSIRDYKSKGYLLSKTEVSELKEQVRQRCKLPQADEKTYPWYYHYELGLAMEHRSDWQRALESFLHALDDRDQPKKFSRIYGMCMWINIITTISD